MIAKTWTPYLAPAAVLPAALAAAVPVLAVRLLLIALALVLLFLGGTALRGWRSGERSS